MVRMRFLPHAVRTASRSLGLAALALTVLSTPSAQEPQRFQAPATPLPPSAERAYRAMVQRVDGFAALETVRYMDQFWRLAGNPGYNSSLDYIRARLLAAGFADSPEKNRPFVRVDESDQTRGWDYQLGTVAFADGEVILSRLRDRISLCINSFSTPKGGLSARLVDVGSGGDPKDYENVDVKGAVVLGDADPGRLWQQAVKARGAAGIISTRVAPYIRPADPKQFTSPDQHDVFQWGSIPYDAEVKSFGFKASARAAARMRERLKNGPVDLRVEIASSFYEGPNRTLVAEIPGSVKPDERIVLVAHVQEPGANDNGSGSGTLQAIASALVGTARGRGLDRPGRTLTFMWLDEVRGSQQWIKAYPDQAKQVQYMFSLDMTGEDVAKTGGTFLIEKQPDPSAVWNRPSDPHTEWGSRIRDGGRGQRQPAERRVPCDLSAPGEGRSMGRQDEPLRRRKRSHRVRRRRNSIRPGLALHRSLLPHEPRSPGQNEPGRNDERRDLDRDRGLVPRVSGRAGCPGRCRPALGIGRRAVGAGKETG